MATASKTVTESTKIYGGKVEIIFYPNSHRYKVDGEWIKSVTTVLRIINNPHLIKWAVDLARGYLQALLAEGKRLTPKDVEDACNLHEEVKTQASDIGTQVHAFCEKFVKNKMAGGTEIIEAPDDEKAQNGVQGFLAWHKDHKVEFTGSERMVYSQEHKYVWTYDVSLKMEGKHFLWDFKTSKAIYASALLQTVGYVRAYEEENGVTFDGIMILRFDKETGSFDTYQLLKTDEIYQRLDEAFIQAVYLQRTYGESESLLFKRWKELKSA